MNAYIYYLHCCFWSLRYYAAYMTQPIFYGISNFIKSMYALFMENYVKVRKIELTSCFLVLFIQTRLVVLISKHNRRLGWLGNRMNARALVISKWWIAVEFSIFFVLFDAFVYLSASSVNVSHNVLFKASILGREHQTSTQQQYSKR